MGEIEWGWSPKQLISHYSREMRKLYRPLFAKAGDAIAEDRLRRQMAARVGRIQKSYVEFDGQRTGWDASLIRDQYTHGNSEALVEVQELRAGGQPPRYTDYFFFINNRLWRRYRAFNQDQFAGLSFDEAAAVFQRRYGKARPVYESNEAAGTKVLKALEWRNDTTSLKAVDNSHFYGVLCLVYSERATERRLDKLRTNTQQQKRGLSPLITALDDTAEVDTNPNIVEHITGKRYKTAQPQDGVSGSGGGSSRGKSRPRKSSGTIFDEPAPTPTGGGNPLDDLDI